MLTLIGKKDINSFKKYRKENPKCLLENSKEIEANPSVKICGAEARTTVLQRVEQKPHSQKDRMKRQRTMYPMKEQDKTPEKLN